MPRLAPLFPDPALMSPAQAAPPIVGDPRPPAVRVVRGELAEPAALTVAPVPWGKASVGSRATGPAVAELPAQGGNRVAWGQALALARIWPVAAR